MGTEKGIASSGAVLTRASKSLLIPVSKLQHGLTITVPVDSDLLVFSYTDPDPQVAQSAAEGVAQAYVAYRTSIGQPAPARTTSATATTPGAVQVVVVTDATLPASPVSPDRLLIITVAAIVGLALGVGVALLRDWMDDGLRGPLDLETQANAPVLAQLPGSDRRRRAGDGLVVVSSPNSAVGDAYRILRTRVLQAAASRHANTLLVTNPGGEDKATIAANLAAALAQSGRNVVLVCADPRWGRADALFGMNEEQGLTSVVQGDAKLADALWPTEVAGLRVLPSGPASTDPSSILQSAAFQGLLKQLQSKHDFVVIDAPPVLASADTVALAEHGLMILLVADAHATSRARVLASANELGHTRDDVIGWVLDHERGVRHLDEVSTSPRAQGMQAAGTSSRQGSRLTWEDVVGESAPSAQNVATSTAVYRAPRSGTRHKTTPNGSNEP
jgi:capsular exopolysaccharide synthesis family protein